MASRFRTIIDKICGLDDRFEMLNERLTLIEKTVGINSFMANEGNVGNVGSGNVGVGSTVPPDVARYQELVKSKENVGVGSTPTTESQSLCPPNPTTESQSLCPPNPTTESQSLCPPNPASGNVGSGEVPDTADDTSKTDGWPRSDGNVGGGSSV